MKMKINFINIKSFVLKHKIKKAYNRVLDSLAIDGKMLCINVGYVSESAIQKLNSEHRGVDKVTDVLSFPFIDMQIGKWITPEVAKAEAHPVTGIIELGDILICENVAQMQAKKYGHSLKREVCFLAVHGFLHVLGFDHQTEEEEKNMNALTEKVLESLRVRR